MSSDIKYSLDYFFRLISAFNDALSRNIEIKINWGREDLGVKRGEQFEIVKQGRNFLDSQTNSELKLSKNPCHSHAKYLVLDDHLTLITSYNLLAFSGNGLASDEITQELGVVITSKPIASQIQGMFNTTE